MGKIFNKFILVFLLLIMAAGTLPAQDSQEGTLGQTRIEKKARIQEGYSDWEHGILFWRSKDDAFYGRFDVRGFMNGAYFFPGEDRLGNSNEDLLSNGTHLRKGRLAIKMQLWHDWRVEWDIDMAEGVVEIKDMYMARMLDKSYLKFGNFKVPFGLEILTSSRYIPFSERSYNGLAFKMGRRFGLEYGKWGDWWNVRADVFGQGFDIQKNKQVDETGGGVAARFAAIPLVTKDIILHLGVSGAWERPDNNQWIVDYNAEPETKIGDGEILDTDLIKNTSHTYRFGFEGAAVYKGFHFQSEFQMTQVNRFENVAGAKDASFYGGYAYLLYTLSGESRPWDKTQGEFGQLIPDNPDVGAWEVGARFSHLSLTDADAGIFGGKANNYTAAVNWYPNSNIVFQTNYTYVANSDNATGNGFVGGDTFSYLQFMAKFFF